MVDNKPAKEHLQELNREISWLSFNERVLQEAENQDVPLVERIRFLAIFSNNLDEFFRVRVASVKRLASLKKYANTQERKTFKDTLERIRKTVLAQQKKFDAIYREDILPALAKSGIRIIENEPLQSAELEFVSSFFSDQLAPKLFPLLLKSGRDLPPLKDGEIYLAVKMSHSVTQALQYALVELPTRQMGRFVKLPTHSKGKQLMMLDDIVRQGLPELFSSLDFDSFSAHTIKITRDAELDIDNDIEANYVEQLRKSIKKRKVGDPTRFIYDEEIPGDLLNFLLKKLKIQREDALPGGRYHNFRDFMAFPNLGDTDWEYSTTIPLHRPELDQAKSLLDHVEKHDVLLSFPYESFGYIVRFIREAAIDPSVFSIQISLYRLAKESSIAAALINAVHNGKSVTIVVELQARFMEEENLLWARKMQEEGAKVIFGKPGFKVHAKLIVISRRKNFKTTHLVHVGTGNFNESTAKVYGDHSYLTARKRIASEALKVFELIQDFRPSAFKFNQLWVSPVNTQQELIRCIATETRNHISGKPARVVLKCNNLVDPFVLQELQKAIDVGVPVDLIIRGICTLPVSMKQSHVRAISIVDRYLEHARIYAFENNGNPLVYMGSADIMQRNLRHRVEVCVPILDKAIKQTLMDVLEIQMADNQKARLLDKDMKNKWAKKYSGSAPWGHAEMEEKLAQQAPVRSQFFLRDYFEHGS